MNESREFSVLQGEVLKSIAGCNPGSDTVTFETESGKTFRMHHYGDCCECVEVVDVAGDVNDLVGQTILLAEVVLHVGETPEDAPKGDHYLDESFTWTFYKLATNKGYATIRWLGTSNGYYSETVDFEEVITADATTT